MEGEIFRHEGVKHISNVNILFKKSLKLQSQAHVLGGTSTMINFETLISGFYTHIL